MAYKRRAIDPYRKTEFPTDKFDSSHKYRTFGYYVLGGMDVTGDHLDVSASVSYDDDSEIESGCEVDALCDPTIGFFEVAESMGVETANTIEQVKSNN